MAKGTKTGGKNFAKGYAGGPGRPKLLQATKDWQRTNVDHFQAVTGNIFLENLAEMVLTLIEIATDKNHRQCVKAQELLYERILGKPKRAPDDEPNSPPPQIISLSIEELTKIAAAKSEN